jgi:hypothetical protein
MGQQGNTQSTKPSKTAVAESAAGVRISPGPYIGLVKNNMDASRSGSVSVWIPELGGKEEDESSWRNVRYCSPFFGATPPGKRTKNSQGFMDSPHSYGFWFVPPDIDIRVMVMFVGGDPNRGYWMGCIPEFPNFHMVPGISSGSWHGGAPDPLVDWNDNDDTADSTKSQFYNRAKTPHEYQKDVWVRQGLLTDPDRGPGISSAFRETPSRVFGISTPGPDIQPANGTEDGAVNQEIDLEVKGRQGGHTFVMDDGTADGKSQLVRLRTSNGNMLLMNDSAGFIYLINSQGSAWFEMDKTGNVRIFSQGQIEMHATSGFCLETPSKFTISASNIDLAAKGAVKISGSTVDIAGSGGVKIGGMGSLDLTGSKILLSAKLCVGVKANQHIDIKGSCITLNTKTPSEAKQPSTAQGCEGPTHEPYTGHISSSTNSPASSPGVAAQSGLPAGNSGRYGAASSFGLIPNTPGYYGAYTNANGPIKFNTGLQSSLAGQAANLGNAAGLNQFDKNAVLYTSVNINLPLATNGFAVNINEKNLNDTTALKTGEKQNNPGDLIGRIEDPFTIGQANGVNVYATPEDGIAALSLALDLIQADGAQTVSDFIKGYVERKGNVA